MGSDSRPHKYDAVVIGTSMGGLTALRHVLSSVRYNFSLPVIIVQHVPADSGRLSVEYLSRHSSIEVKEVEAHEKLKAGVAYVAPANYHLLIEDDYTLSLSLEAPVNFSRPSIDVLFESAAEVFRHRLIGIIMTGANKDGSYGMQKIKEHGGLIVVENPESAHVGTMPQAVIDLVQPHFILHLGEIGPFLMHLESGPPKTA